MPHDVFISYSQKDKAAADAICAGIEQAGFRVWIAPRDIPYGADWGGSIVEAISATTVFILVFTTNANSSPQVKREVQLAFEHEKLVIPFRLDETKPAKSLEYYVTAVHWLDAFTEPLSQHIDSLALRLGTIIGQPSVTPNQTASMAEPDPPAPIDTHPIVRDEIAKEKLSHAPDTVEVHQHVIEEEPPTTAPVGDSSDAVLRAVSSSVDEPPESSNQTAPPVVVPNIADGNRSVAAIVAAESVSAGMSTVDASAHVDTVVMPVSEIIRAPEPLNDLKQLVSTPEKPSEHPASEDLPTGSEVAGGGNVPVAPEPGPQDALAPSWRNAWSLYKSRPWPWIVRMVIAAALYSGLMEVAMQWVRPDISDPENDNLNAMLLLDRYAACLAIVALMGVSLHRLARYCVDKTNEIEPKKNGIVAAIQLVALYAAALVPIALIDTISMLNVGRFSVYEEPNNIFDVGQASSFYMLASCVNTVIAAGLFLYALPAGAALCAGRRRPMKAGIRAIKRAGAGGFLTAVLVTVMVNIGAIAPMFWLPLAKLVGYWPGAAVFHFIWLTVALCLVLPPWILYSALLTTANDEPAAD